MITKTLRIVGEPKYGLFYRSSDETLSLCVEEIARVLGLPFNSLPEVIKVKGSRVRIHQKNCFEVRVTTRFNTSDEIWETKDAEVKGLSSIFHKRLDAFLFENKLVERLNGIRQSFCCVVIPQ